MGHLGLTRRLGSGWLGNIAETNEWRNTLVVITEIN